MPGIILYNMHDNYDLYIYIYIYIFKFENVHNIIKIYIISARQ